MPISWVVQDHVEGCAVDVVELCVMLLREALL